MLFLLLARSFQAPHSCVAWQALQCVSAAEAPKTVFVGSQCSPLHHLRATMSRRPSPTRGPRASA